MAKKKITISDMIDRFGRERIVKALTKRRFTNKKRSEMRKTGQKHMGFMSGGFGIFSKRKNVEAGEPDKKKKKNVIKENVTKKQKRLEELKKELGMKKGGSTSKSKQKTKPKRIGDTSEFIKRRLKLMGLKSLREMKMKKGGVAGLPGRKKPRKPVVPPRGTDPTRPKPKLPPYLKKMQEKKSGMKKGGMKKADGVMLIIEKKAAGGITGKTTFGELSKRKPLKKGIRLKGKGSSFMKEYKKRVYNRAGGGSVNGGARGTGIAVKGHNFKGVF
tara:strand:- start:3145 stop:3963 length:819 start_codon:yes stop_codon:yes gene_type:complete